MKFKRWHAVPHIQVWLQACAEGSTMGILAGPLSVALCLVSESCRPVWHLLQIKIYLSVSVSFAITVSFFSFKHCKLIVIFFNL